MIGPGADMNRVMLIGTCIGFIFGMSPAFASAAPTVEVIVDDLGADAKRCGLDRASLESTASLVLTNKGLQVSTDKQDVHLYVQVMSILVSVGCVASLNVSILSNLFPMKSVNGFTRRKSGIVGELCGRGVLVTRPVRDMKETLLKRVEEMTLACLGDLEY